ncbi:MAG TPA: hypothetical protein VL461_11150 [Dictyobacter sp.]|nr:hypothetical protein [Dictyobacter sp.]
MPSDSLLFRTIRIHDDFRVDTLFTFHIFVGISHLVLLMVILMKELQRAVI